MAKNITRTQLQNELNKFVKKFGEKSREVQALFDGLPAKSLNRLKSKYYEQLNNRLSYQYKAAATSPKAPDIKPVLGLKPERIHRRERINDIFAAMHRYSAVQKPIPTEWIEEVNILTANGIFVAFPASAG